MLEIVSLFMSVNMFTACVFHRFDLIDFDYTTQSYREITV